VSLERSHQKISGTASAPIKTRIFARREWFNVFHGQLGQLPWHALEPRLSNQIGFDSIQILTKKLLKRFNLILIQYRFNSKNDFI
jgi:hypothetical protein